MKKFKFTLSNGNSHGMVEGEIEAYNITRATERIKEAYAAKLNVEINEISIYSIQEVIS